MKIYQTAGKGQDTKPARVIHLRCPACRRVGSFEGIGDTKDIGWRLSDDPDFTYFGRRLCPNPECRAFIFVVRTRDGEVVESYPPEVVDFDPSAIPEQIVETFSEALTCHANNCHRAAAIMVRRTLEELVADRGAVGENLKQRIESLGGTIVIPPALIEGADALRLLGNDAAHIEAQTFVDVGMEEVAVAIDFTKELLKAVYQLEELVARLKNLGQTE